MSSQFPIFCLSTNTATAPHHLQWSCLPVAAWVKVFRIIPEFRILRLTFQESLPQNAELSGL